MTTKKTPAAELNFEQRITLHNGKPVTTSRMIAEAFQRRHDNVLRDIKILPCSNEFRLLNFEESSYLNE